ncbi:MAG: hypothetical protein ACK4RK_19505 [Gemmataceae bacterium]
MSMIRATYDGKVFVPCELVELPVGTVVEVHTPAPPPKPTAEEQRE